MQVDLESFPRWLCKIVLMCKREDILTATGSQLGLPGAIVWVLGLESLPLGHPAAVRLLSTCFCSAVTSDTLLALKDRIQFQIPEIIV